MKIVDRIQAVLDLHCEGKGIPTDFIADEIANTCFRPGDRLGSGVGWLICVEEDSMSDSNPPECES